MSNTPTEQQVACVNDAAIERAQNAYNATAIYDPDDGRVRNHRACMRAALEAARLQVGDAEPIATITGTYGAGGHVIFPKGGELPIGTKLYTHPSVADGAVWGLAAKWRTERDEHHRGGSAVGQCLIACAGDLERAFAVTTTPELRNALKLYEYAFDELFSQALSNGLYDAWRRPISCTLLNNAHSAATKALAGEKP